MATCTQVRACARRPGAPCALVYGSRLLLCALATHCCSLRRRQTPVACLRICCPVRASCAHASACASQVPCVCTAQLIHCTMAKITCARRYHTQHTHQLHRQAASKVVGLKGTCDAAAGALLDAGANDASSAGEQIFSAPAGIDDVAGALEHWLPPVELAAAAVAPATDSSAVASSCEASGALCSSCSCEAAKTSEPIVCGLRVHGHRRGPENAMGTGCRSGRSLSRIAPYKSGITLPFQD